ncbi:rod shape-determining protein RodA [Anaerotignum sp. MB30-C6]|uniref:rod shape-determining protein RodA n=1 Tax=Anaerotignum sp. MB30-C6 TaxID=3070814 RepID=UPI0027DB90B4|nr:rod shape-determining protein RodA [Anaerotignum sp. MB30-C6]WMI81252.1 rod shape-determining protein RodA [Anaerotignum sp. MB30-C6]
MEFKKYFQNFDWPLLGAVGVLTIFGLVAIASATHVNLGESATFVVKQGAFFVVGIILMLIAANVDYEYFSQFHIPIYCINLLLLMAVLLIGTGAKGAVRWIAIGPLTIQPSEFAKIMMIFCLAKVITTNHHKINRLPFLAFLCIYVMVPIVLIQKQPALSASLVLIAIFCIQLFVAGLSYTFIRNVLIITVPIIAFILWDVARENPLIMDKIFEPHQFNRILSFVDPKRDASLYYQTEKSISAIGSGQLTGQGLFSGTLNQLSYLPEPHNDFIFSVVGEEFGFIGCIFVLGVLLFIVFRCIVIAISSRNLFSQLVVAGIAGMFAFQTFVNAGVALGILPNTGMSLPFVSYGGSSMWANMVAIGLVLNIRKKETKSLFEGGLL